MLRQWIKNGFVVLEGVVSHQECDRLAAEIAEIFWFGSEKFLYQEPEAPPGVGHRVPVGLAPDRMRLVDMYGASPTAASVLMNDKICRFLEIVFDDSPLCFQGLTFEKGSGQGFHQDTAYVVIDQPLELAAAWIALEDIQPNSGELMYIVGSHQLTGWKFGGTSKHWDPDLHGSEAHDEWSQRLIRRSEEMGLEKRLFRPRKGDVLIWSADLVHGGSPVGDKSLSRRSIVGHYCPVARTPHYFTYLSDRVKVPYRRGYFSSAYFGLAEGPGDSDQAPIGEDA